jgi:hypothetical protein
MATMRERPIIFNAEMVRAVLSGSKTQTRRIVRHQPCRSDLLKDQMVFPRNKKEYDRLYPTGLLYPNAKEDVLKLNPFGAVGDRLWVRERARVVHRFGDMASIRFEADGFLSAVPMPDRIKPVPVGQCLSNGCYREAARITLEITGVRVERLHAITLGDICKEFGCGLYDCRPATYGFQSWEELWQSIYGEESWQANPWVWVIAFKRVEGV